jgi:hypothetical protein
MSKITESARGETCTFQIPGICNGNTETTVLCHGRHPDKGMGKKGPDSWGAYGCSSCHDEMDRRTHNYGIGRMHHLELWHHAIRETQRRLIAKGLMPK